MPDPVGLGAGKQGASLLASLFTLRRDTTRNNDLVARQYEDRVWWVREQSKEELKSLTAFNDLPDHVRRAEHPEGMDPMLRRYALACRERRSEGDRLIRDVQYSENLFHRVYRLVARKRWPSDPWSDEITATTERWDERSADSQHTGLLTW